MATTIDDRPLSLRQIRIIYFGLMLGVFVSALDQTIVATALPTIVGDLGGLSHLSWVVTAYLLAATATTPIYGKLGDLFGRKLIFQIAIVTFIVGSILSGLSHTMIELIASRALQGLGAGGIFPLVMAIVGDILSPRERGKYQGFLNGVFTVASISGPAIGGLFVQHLSWRWCFYVNLPVGAVALTVITTQLHLPVESQRRKIDYLGSALLSLTVLCVLLVSVWGGGAYPWISPRIIGLVVAGVVLAVAFVINESHVEEPLLPLRLFRVPSFRIVSGVGFLTMMAMVGTTAYLPLFLQLVTNTPPTLSGLLLVPQSLSVTVLSVVVGKRVSKTGHYKLWPVIGSVLVPLGLLGLSTLSPQSSHLEVAGVMIVLGCGMGMILTVIVVALQNDVDRRDMGTATGAYMFFRSVGSSFGVALYGAIMNARLRYWFPRLEPRTDAHRISISNLADSPAKVHSLPPALRSAVVESFARSLHVVFLVGAPLAALTVPLLLMLRERPLRTVAFVQNDEVVQVESVGSTPRLARLATDTDR
jgi:EmrB/QacA subfamily drug resistance transporter